jgi:hypothetical protein
MAAGDIIARAELMARRQQAQVTNQIASINRLLRDGSYSSEMEELHRELVDRDLLIEDLKRKIKELTK